MRPADARRLALAALRAQQAMVYRHEATWSGGTICRFSVVDPGPASAAQLQAAAASRGLPFEDMRLVYVHPDDPRPQVQATLPWDGGVLELLGWGQTSDFTGTAVGTAVMRR